MLPPPCFQDELMYDFIAVTSQTNKVIDVRALKISLIIQPYGIIPQVMKVLHTFPPPLPFPAAPTLSP